MWAQSQNESETVFATLNMADMLVEALEAETLCNTKAWKEPLEEALVGNTKACTFCTTFLTTFLRSGAFVGLEALTALNAETL